jgi:1-acyl-sn-glycerol-3-phosphate acyltransferase
MLKTCADMILKMSGWRVAATAPPLDSYVLIGAPHTSNWDFPLTLLALSSMGIRCNWVAKHTLFRWPLGPLLKMIGGIPVDRSSGSAFLKRIIELYERNPNLKLAIAPEGTRSKTRYWKKGFYIIAVKAGVPIVPGYLDYAKKVIGLGPPVSPTGDLHKDFEELAAVYRGKTGRRQENQGEIRVK